MKHTSIAAGFFVLIASSCGSAVQEQRAEPRRGETVTTAPEPRPTARLTFTKSLERGGFTAEITAMGADSRHLMALTARQSGREMAAIRDSVAGEIADAVLTDLNQNELPEVLVFVRGTGPNAQGQVYGYEFAPQNWERFQLPTLPSEAAAGYRGQDQFVVTGDDLVRTFPIYRPTDGPGKPTGGQRTVRYALDHTLRLMELDITDQRQ